MTPNQIEQTARQIERAYPGYHVWASDEGWWYATRTSARARGESPTVHGADPGELTTELAAEESSVLDRALSTATCSPTRPCRASSAGPAPEAGMDPDQVKFRRTVRIVRRRAAGPAALPPLNTGNVSSPRSWPASPAKSTSTPDRKSTRLNSSH